jgi:topoisomerase IA-like protein
MPKYTVKVQPLGLLSVAGEIGVPWPEAGETVDLPESVGKDMVASGALEEKKPAKKAAAKKAAAKADESEKRPASKAATETRKSKS